MDFLLLVGFVTFAVGIKYFRFKISCLVVYSVATFVGFNVRCLDGHIVRLLYGSLYLHVIAR